MGIDRSDYIVYGWKLPYELYSKGVKIDLWDDKFLPMIEGHKSEEFIIVRDGMSGKYNVFGLKVKSCGDLYEGWNFEHLDVKNLDAEKVKSRYKELFEIEGEVAEPYLFIFSHFS